MSDSAIIQHLSRVFCRDPGRLPDGSLLSSLISSQAIALWSQLQPSKSWGYNLYATMPFSYPLYISCTTEPCSHLLIHIKVWFLSLPSWPAVTRQLIILSLDKVDSLNILMNPRSLGTHSVCCALSNVLLFITLKLFDAASFVFSKHSDTLYNSQWATSPW